MASLRAGRSTPDRRSFEVWPRPVHRRGTHEQQERRRDPRSASRASPSRGSFARGSWRHSSARRCSRRCRSAIAPGSPTSPSSGATTDGAEIVRAGEPGDSFHVVLEGEALVTAADGSASNSLEPGDHFGELSLLDGAPRAATVTADGEVTTGRVSRADFQKRPARGAGARGRPPPRPGARGPRHVADRRRAHPRPEPGGRAGKKAETRPWARSWKAWTLSAGSWSCAT